MHLCGASTAEMHRFSRAYAQPVSVRSLAGIAVEVPSGSRRVAVTKQVLQQHAMLVCVLVCCFISLPGLWIP